MNDIIKEIVALIDDAVKAAELSKYVRELENEVTRLKDIVDKQNKIIKKITNAR